jgi:hypothetical protein
VVWCGLSGLQLGPGKHPAKTGVWFGEMERKLAKLSKTTFTYRSSSELFYAGNDFYAKAGALEGVEKVVSSCYTLLRKLNASPDYSVSDNGYTH